MLDAYQYASFLQSFTSPPFGCASRTHFFACYFYNAVLIQLDEVLPVVFELFDRFVDIGQSLMFTAFLEA